MSDQAHEATPQREPPYDDSGEWRGSRCPKCTYTTYVDAQATNDEPPQFCGACGNQLTSDDVMEIEGTAPEMLRNEVGK